MNIAKAPIGNAVESVAPDHVVTTADQIYDEALGKYQSEINQEGGGGGGNVSDVFYDNNNKKIYKTVDGNTDDVVTAAQLKSDMALDNVENKSSETIRGEITKNNVTTALGYTPPETDTTYEEATLSEAGLMSSSDKDKLDNIAANATKVEASETNGNIKIDGTETTVYTHQAPTSAEIVEALGYTPPQQDTNTTYQFQQDGNTLKMGTDGGTKNAIYTPSLSKSDVGLDNVDNTHDADKSVAYAESAGNVPLNFYHQFGTFFRDVQYMYCPNITLGWGEGMVITESYVYLFFIRDIDNLDYTVCVLYDRNFNCLGYSTIDNYQCHANDATVYNGDIYIAVCMNDYHGILKVSATTLAANCQNQNHPSTAATKILSDKHIIGIDYDPVSDTFAANENYNLVIYDTSFNLVKTVKTDYMSEVSSTIGGDITSQGLIYRNGNIECYDSYHWLGGDSTGCILVSTYNIESGTLEKISYVIPDFLAETEGVCKDPLTGVVWGVNMIEAYRQNTAFSVGYYNVDRIPSDINVKSIVGTGIHSFNNGLPIYVDNSYSGKSNGSKAMPYKSVGEAFVSRIGAISRFIILLKYTGTDYYSNSICINDSSIELRTYNSSTKPTLITSIRADSATITLSSIKLTGSTQTDPNRESLLLLQGNCYLITLGCEFELLEDYKNAIYGEYCNTVVLENVVFSAPSSGQGAVDLTNRTSDWNAIKDGTGELHVEFPGTVTCNNLTFIHVEGNGPVTLAPLVWWYENDPSKKALTLNNSLFATVTEKTVTESHGPCITLPDVDSGHVYSYYKSLAAVSSNEPVFRATARTYGIDSLVGNLYNNQGKLESYEQPNYPIISSLSGRKISANTVLSDITKSGTYYCMDGTTAATISDSPYKSGNFRLWHIINTGLEDDGTQQWSSQILLAPSAGRMWIRGHDGSSVGDWVEFYTVKSISGTVRPTDVPVGYTFFDTSSSINKPIFHKGNNVWVDATGTEV